MAQKKSSFSGRTFNGDALPQAITWRPVKLLPFRLNTGPISNLVTETRINKVNGINTKVLLYNFKCYFTILALFICIQPPDNSILKSTPLVTMQTRRPIRRFVTNHVHVLNGSRWKSHCVCMNGCMFLKGSVCFLFPAVSRETKEEAGEDGGPAGQKRTAEEAPQSSGIRLSGPLRFTRLEWSITRKPPVVSENCIF